MSMPELTREWTVDDLADLPDDGNRYEVIDGELLVTPSPALTHQAAVGELYLIVAPYVATQKIGFTFVAPADVIFSPRRGVQPDVFVTPPVDGRRPKKVNRLLLAVEVLSPSTARSDRVKKRNMFRDEGVPEYWIVDLDARTFERSTPAEPRPEIISERLIWSPPGASAPLEVDLVAYFQRVLDV
jgi:Uma2 family endonuclease